MDEPVVKENFERVDGEGVLLKLRRQQESIDELTRLVCAQAPAARMCK